MTQDQAHQILGTSSYCSGEELRRAFEGRTAEVEKEAQRAPTPSLKAKYQTTLGELTEAYELLRKTAGAEANYPYVGARSPGGATGAMPPPVPEPSFHATAAPGETRARPVDAAAGRRDSSTARSAVAGNWFEGRAPVLVGVAVALLVLIVGYFVFNAAKARMEEAGEPGRPGGAFTSTLPEVQQAKTVKDCLLFAAEAKRQGNHKRAIEFYRKAQEIEPTNKDVAALLTDISSQLGKLLIGSDPKGATAEVFLLEKPPVEGAPVSLENVRPSWSGTTPFEFVGLPYDEYVVRVTRRGYDAPALERFSILGPAVKTKHFVLVRQKGKLTVNTEPSALPYVLTRLKPDTDDAQYAPFVENGSTPVNAKDYETGRYRLEIPALAISREVDLMVDKLSDINLAGVAGGKSSPTNTTSNTGGMDGAEPKRVEPAPTPIELPVQTDRPAYRAGEAVVLTVTPPFEGYLTIVSEDANRQTTVIFPNGFEGAGGKNKVAAGQTVRIPSIGTYDLNLELPAGVTEGKERVIAYLSDRPSADARMRNITPEDPFPSADGTAEAAIDRGISGRAKRAAMGVVEYQVKP